MKQDITTQIVQLHASLVKEKTSLEHRLAVINKALGSIGGSVSNGTSKSKAAVAIVTLKPKKRGKRGGARRRLDNPMPLKKAIIQVTKAKPLTKEEILAAVQKLGYRFTGPVPMNSINVHLYTKGQFKKHSGGRFGPL
jgi:hypothetical protein